MKIDIVLTSVNNNSYYYNLYPYIQKVWKEKFNLDLICIFIGNKLPEILEPFKDNFILFEQIDGLNDIYVAQLIRILYPALFENKNVLITDMDILPISKKYFIESIQEYDDNKFIAYTNRYLKQNMIAICYNIANSNIWKKIFNINNIEDIKNFLIKNYNVEYNGIKNCPGWYSDQKLLYKYIINNENLILMDDKKINYRRLDGKSTTRLNNLLKYKGDIIENINNYSDFHILKNYHKYIPLLNKIINNIISN